MVFVLLLSSGCKKSLENETVRDVRARMAPGAEQLCPGQTGGLIFEAMLETGDIWATPGAGGGRLTWDELQIRVNGANVSESGEVSIPADPRLTLATPAELWVRDSFHPEKVAYLKLPVHYACAYVSRFDGPSGQSGQQGAAGQRGRDGQSNTSTGSYAQPGGDGEGGQNGGDGGPGSPGGPAGAAEVWAVAVQVDGFDVPLLQVLARGNGQSEMFLVDPRGGSVLVTANGGEGGSGGMGGFAGGGGTGGTGAPAGNGGNGGDGGNGGSGAPGGSGGSIAVVLDPSAAQFQQIFRFENAGGRGGAPGGAGPSGSGGNAFSGGQQGQSGRLGLPGQGAYDGPPGPPVQMVVSPVERIF